MLESCEDRTTPTPTVTIAALSDGHEGGTNAVFRLTRSDTTDPLVSGTATFSGTATAGSDYSSFGTAYWSFGIGAATTDVTVFITDDSTSEPTETITLTLDSGTGYTVGSPASATVNIFDNDAQYVSVSKIDDATEGGTAGKFTFTRIGDLSSSLTANFSVSGTATSGTDFTSIGTTVTFAAGSATADKTVTAATDSIYDPDETVDVAVTSGTGYSVGSPSSAELSITDDISTVQTLIHQQTFQLTGSSGNVDVTLTVTLNAPGAAGLYTWSYTVSNPPLNSSSLTSFSIPVDGMDTDVANLTSSIGWTGTVGTDSVSWAAGTGLTPGSSATFSFTTDPREVGDGDIEADGGGGFLADLPTAPAPRQKADVPSVNVNFTNATQNYTLKLDVTVAQGTGLSSGNMNVVAANASTARDFVYGFLKDNGWAVEKAGDNGFRILGKVESNGTITAVKSLNWKITNSLSGNAIIEGFGPVTITNN